MREHTTHFDDCGCKSAGYETIIRELEEERDFQKQLIAILIVQLMDYEKKILHYKQE